MKYRTITEKRHQKLLLKEYRFDELLKDWKKLVRWRNQLQEIIKRMEKGKK